MSSVEYRVVDGIAVVTLDHPPVNAIGHAIRAGLLAAIERLAADAAATAAVVIGAHQTFVAGADIREFGQPLRPPSLLEALAGMETSTKPIVAAVEGNALGGGLEIALACHFRAASPSARLGLPEVNLGILPGAGGTQRLTRLVGASAALELITSGSHFDGRRGLALGVVDELVEGPLLEGALAFARKVVAERRPLVLASRRTDKVAGTDPAIFDEFRRRNEKKWKGLLSPWKIVDCVEKACTAPWQEGAAFERAAYHETQASPQRPALTYLFFAEREAAKVPGLSADLEAAPIASAAVVGAGTMGGGIAMSLANNGVPVKLLDVDAQALEKGLARIRGNYETSVSRGSMSVETMRKALALIAPASRFEEIGDADLVIEAVFEEMGIKQDVFRKLDAVMKPGATLATNTSTLDIDQIAAATRRPEDVIGTHFFSPANVMKLQENVRGARSSPATIARAMRLARRIGKVAVLAGNCDGFIGNRILAVYGRECDYLLEEGATPWQVDRALQGFGFPMGLYLMRDMAGLDVGWRIRKYREEFRDKSQRYSPIADRICEQGRFGQKTGAGYYRYEGRNPAPDPEIETLIEKTAADLGIRRRAVTDEEIVWRVLCSMVNEGAKIVGEGIAARASDIDVTYVFGYGFPRYQGGPMFWAERQGLAKVRERIGSYHSQQGAAWAPAPLLEKAVNAGATTWKEAATFSLAKM